MTDGIIKPLVLTALAICGYAGLRVYEYRHGATEVVAQSRKAEKDREAADIVQQLAHRLSAGPRVVDVLVVNTLSGDSPHATLLFQERTSDDSLMPARRVVVEGKLACFTVVFVPLNQVRLPVNAGPIATGSRIPLITGVMGDSDAAKAPPSVPAPGKAVDEPAIVPFVYRGPDVPVNDFQLQLWKDVWQRALFDPSLTKIQSEWVPLKAGAVYTLTLQTTGSIGITAARLTDTALAQLQESGRKLTPSTSSVW